MFLIIENSQDGKIILYYTVDTKWLQRDFITDNRGVLQVIDELLRMESKELGDIKGIGVLLGIGRFTGTRIATTVANTLAYALKIPVVGLSEINYKKFENLLSKTPVGQYVSAKYSGEANIGKAKKK